MKKILAAGILLLTFLTSSSISQQSDSTSRQSDFTNKSKWALQFEVGYDLKVSAFQGLTFSLKYQLSEESGLRFGVGYLGRVQDEKYNEHDPFFDYSIKLGHREHWFTLSCNYIFYTNTSSAFNLFWGIGPTGKFSYYYNEYPDYERLYYKDAYESFSWAAGLNGVLGVEWFPVKNFSLFAEYEASGLYGKTKETYWLLDNNGFYWEKNTSSSDDWSFNGNTARLGLSVYFDKLF